jgi:hypothetical protein
VKLALILPVQSPADFELACRPVAGRSWIIQLIRRLRRATSVERIVVACRQRDRELAAVVDSETVSVVASDDPIGLAASLEGDHDGVSFCPVAQLFVDPRRLDAIASLELQPDTTRACAVLSCDPTIVLTGGAFLEVVMRAGLHAPMTPRESPNSNAAMWHTCPEPPEMRLETWGDFDWAVRANAALLARDPSGAVDHFEDILTESGLHRFTFWDEMGPAPRSVLMVRCLRPQLFEPLLRHLTRLPGSTVDVLCRAEHADQTRALPGIGEVFTFGAPTFSVDALAPTTLAAIRARAYDLCVLPRREATGYGFDNVAAFGNASGAATAIWIDIFGRSGLIAGRWHGWDETTAGGPHERPDYYLRRALSARDCFTRQSARALHVPGGFSV